MAAERKGDFGSKLRAARERRGVSLRQIAARTKISVSALEALEKNDITRLPGGIFSRAFVRSYAAEIGLDPEEAIEDFIAQFPHDSVTAGHPQTSQADDFDAIESERRTASAFLKLVAISLPIAGVVLYYGTAGRRKTAGDAVHGVAVAGGASGSTNLASDRGAAAGPPAVPAVAREPLSVELTARRVCAVTVTIDGTAQPEHLLAAGDRERFAADRELVLKVADAAAVSWTINGEPARPLGLSGQPATISLTLANYKDYVIPR
jgi:transcriptional regulator with XRE-family HTH domain